MDAIARALNAEIPNVHVECPRDTVKTSPLASKLTMFECGRLSVSPNMYLDAQRKKDLRHYSSRGMPTDIWTKARSVRCNLFQQEEHHVTTILIAELTNEDHVEKDYVIVMLRIPAHDACPMLALIVSSLRKLVPFHVSYLSEFMPLYP